MHARAHTEEECLWEDKKEWRSLCHKMTHHGWKY